jgi:hypothetical protein
MHSANFTALSRAVSFVFAPLLAVPVPVLVVPVLVVPVLLAPVLLAPVLLAPVLLAVPELLAVPVLEDALEPQPAVIRPIRPARPRATNGRSFLVMFAPYV